MDKAAVLGVLAKFRQALQLQGINDTRIILFGSHVSGVPREDSDIDVVVVSRRFHGKSEWERIEILSKAICASHSLIEAVALTPQEWDGGEFTVAEFAKEGEVVAV